MSNTWLVRLLEHHPWNITLVKISETKLFRLKRQINELLSITQCQRFTDNGVIYLIICLLKYKSWKISCFSSMSQIYVLIKPTEKKRYSGALPLNTMDRIQTMHCWIRFVHVGLKSSKATLITLYIFHKLIQKLRYSLWSVWLSEGPCATYRKKTEVFVSSA